MFTTLEVHAPPLEHWKWKKITLWFFGVLTVFVIAIIAYDEELKPYDDLLPTIAKVPDVKSNGFLFLKERWERLPQTPPADREKITKMLAGTEPWDAAWVEKHLVEGVTFAEELKQALLLPQFSTPIYLDLRDAGKDSHSWMMRPLRVLLLEMEVKCRSGDWAGSMAIRKDLQETVRRYRQGSNSLISLLVAASFNSMLCENTCQLLKQGSPDATISAGLADFWQTESPLIPVWEEVIKHEARFGLSAIELLRKGEPVFSETPPSWRERLFLKPNKTGNQFHEKQRTLIRIPFRVSSTQPITPLQEVTGTPHWIRYFNANYYGQLFLETDGYYRHIIPGLTDSALFRPRALRVRIAIHRWQLQHPGRWPATLQELVPDFLPEVPADPWNGQPLQWDPAAKIISAVGSDWAPGPAKFDKDRSSWFAEDRENPGLRLQIPPLPPPKPVLKAKPKPAKPASASTISPAAPASSN